MVTKKSQINLLSHSKAKVKLFGDYIQKYLNIICNDGYTETINIFDLFCGKGIYEDRAEGSPVIALRKIQETYDKIINEKTYKKPKINCYFNDFDKSAIDILESYIAENNLHSDTFGDLNFSNEDYQNIISSLPQEFKGYNNTKAFIFIDPYGYKDIRPEHISSLLDCNGNSEVLLWLPIQFMYRFAKKGTPEVLEDFNSYLGIKLDEFNDEWNYIDALKKGFQEFLGNKYFVDSFTLQKDKNTTFCLFFFSSHIRGYEKMLEAKWDIDFEQGRGWNYNTGVPTLFEQVEHNELEEKLINFIKDPRSNNDIYEFTLRQGFLPKHSNEVLRKLQNCNMVDVERVDGQKNRKGAFYINYEKYKKNLNEIIIKIKQCHNQV